MPQGPNPDIRERAKALRQKTSSVHGKTEGLLNRIRQRATQLLSSAAATEKKTLHSWGSNSNIVKFLKVDLDVAMTFAQIALQSRSDHEKRARNQANARKAHDAVVRWKNRVEISQSDALEIDAKFQRLKSALEKLGERL